VNCHRGHGAVKVSHASARITPAMTMARCHETAPWKAATEITRLVRLLATGALFD